MDDLMKEYNKGLKQMIRERTIKECFHPNKSDCVLPIKQAHSLQKKGRLSLIEEPINGQNLIFTVTSFSSDKKTHLKEFIPIGKNEASTFYGFCDTHDTKVFSPIENFSFDGSDKHLFLHSYRSFAHSYHQKRQEIQLYKSEWNTLKKMPKEILELLIERAELGLKDIQPEKEYLDEILLSEAYNQLEYSLFETNDFYPFGCSSLITPHFSVNDKPLEDDIKSTTLPWVSIILTVVPDKKNSFIIVAANPNNKKAVLFLDELDALPDEKYLHAISTLTTTMAENTFWSPILWNAMSTDAKNTMKNDARYVFDSDQPKRFPWSSLNLFQNRFTAQNLGINKD